MTQDWRHNVPAADRAHWENVHAQEAAIANRAADDGVTYEYLPWYDVRGRQDFVGKVACVAYWTDGFGRLPWGHQHAHAYAFAFKRISAIGVDWVAFEGENSRVMITSDILCVQHSR